MLPRIRARVRGDLRKKGLPREKVLATIVRLLETTLIRVGNEEYARENHSYGLTTLRDRHVEIQGSAVRFHFRGKSGVWHDVEFQERRLARIVKACQELPGQELFQYRDESGVVHDVHSDDVNEYLHASVGEEFTAKDFRTWAATVLAARALREFEAFDSKTQARRNVMAAIESVAKQLGNTKTICRKCYVHPAVVDAYLDGTLAYTLTRTIDKKLSRDLRRLKPEEATVLAFLHERLRNGKHLK
jgi:DNA topoisomerase-1